MNWTTLALGAEPPPGRRGEARPDEAPLGPPPSACSGDASICSRPGDVSREDGLLSLTEPDMGLRATLHGVDEGSASALPFPASSNFVSSAFADSAPFAAGPSSAAGATSSGLAAESSLAFWADRLPFFSLPFLRTSFRSRRKSLTSSSPLCDRVSESFVAVRPKCPFSSSSPSAPQRGPQSPCPRKASAEAARRPAPLSQNSAFCR